MEISAKHFYEAPLAMVLEMQEEDVFCASDVKGGNSINAWGNGGTTNDEVYM